jgi:hypothetical protein
MAENRTTKNGHCFGRQWPTLKQPHSTASRHGSRILNIKLSKDNYPLMASIVIKIIWVMFSSEDLDAALEHSESVFEPSNCEHHTVLCKAHHLCKIRTGRGRKLQRRS